MRSASLALMAATVGCGPSGESGSVLLSLEARAAGGALQVDGQRLEPILPREFAADADVRLVGLGSDERLVVEPGRIRTVGTGGALDWLDPGLDFEPDSLLLDAPEAAARELGDALGAEVDGDGEAVWRIRGSGVVEAAAIVDEPEGLVEARLVEPETPVMLPLPSELSPIAPMLSAPLSDDDEGQRTAEDDGAPDRVGIFEEGGGFRMVDASGGVRTFRCGLSSSMESP